MGVAVCMYVFRRARASLCIRMYGSAHMCVCVCWWRACAQVAYTWVYPCTAQVCGPVPMHAYGHIGLYTCMCVWTCAYVCASVCVSGKCFSYFHLATSYLEILVKMQILIQNVRWGEARDSVSSKIW